MCGRAEDSAGGVFFDAEPIPDRRGGERNPKTREERRVVNEGIPLLTDLCLAVMYDRLGMIGGLEEVVT